MQLTWSRVLLYASFCVLATIVNLGAQRGVLSFGTSTHLFATAVFIGTAAGLVVKYLLDKHWIFHDQTQGVKAQGKQFGLYTAMGIVTTAIFWVTETGFWLIWQTDAMRELGAIIGLTIGYVVKYLLDRRYVFT